MLPAKDLIAELDATLDQLLENAKILKSNCSFLQEAEIDLLERTQTSLTAHFFHTQEHLVSKKKLRALKWKEKMTKLEELNPSFAEFAKKEVTTQHLVEIKPRIGRNRKRLKLGQFS